MLVAMKILLGEIYIKDQIGKVHIHNETKFEQLNLNNQK